jgi:rhodanese-related sulfurtransferase
MHRTRSRPLRRPAPLLATLLALTLSAGATACGSERDDAADGPPVAAATDASLRTIAPGDFATVLSDTAGITVIDVRTPMEFEGPRLAGAVNVDFEGGAFEQGMAAFDRDAPIAIYCRSGNRSGQAMSILRSMGFTDVVDLEGGIIAWADAGLPIAGM